MACFPVKALDVALNIKHIKKFKFISWIIFKSWFFWWSERFLWWEISPWKYGLFSIHNIFTTMPFPWVYNSSLLTVTSLTCDFSGPHFFPLRTLMDSQDIAIPNMSLTSHKSNVQKDWIFWTSFIIPLEIYICQERYCWCCGLPCRFSTAFSPNGVMPFISEKIENEFPFINLLCFLRSIFISVSFHT